MAKDTDKHLEELTELVSAHIRREEHKPDQLDNIEAEVKEHTKILASVDKTLALQAQQLENHMRRTEIAEENIRLLREEFKPVQAQSEFVKKLIRLTVLVAGLGASIGAIFGAINVVLHWMGKL